MTPEQLREQQQIDALIEVLNLLGYNIVCIDNTYYIFSSFNPAEGIVTKHQIRGKLLSKIKDLHIQVSMHDLTGKNQLIDKVESLPFIIREYSSSYLWKTYLKS